MLNSFRSILVLSHKEFIKNDKNDKNAKNDNNDKND
jgi:hypothetical protein